MFYVYYWNTEYSINFIFLLYCWRFLWRTGIFLSWLRSGIFNECIVQLLVVSEKKYQKILFKKLEEKLTSKLKFFSIQLIKFMLLHVEAQGIYFFEQVAILFYGIWIHNWRNKLRSSVLKGLYLFSSVCCSLSMSYTGYRNLCSFVKAVAGQAHSKTLLLFVLFSYVTLHYNLLI